MSWNPNFTYSSHSRPSGYGQQQVFRSQPGYYSPQILQQQEQQRRIQEQRQQQEQRRIQEQQRRIREQDQQRRIQEQRRIREQPQPPQPQQHHRIRPPQAAHHLRRTGPPLTVPKIGPQSRNPRGSGSMTPVLIGVPRAPVPILPVPVPPLLVPPPMRSQSTRGRGRDTSQIRRPMTHRGNKQTVYHFLASSYPFSLRERDFGEIQRRYPRLFILGDFVRMYATWVDTLPETPSYDLNRYIGIECDDDPGFSTIPPPSSLVTPPLPAETPEGHVRYNVRVMICTGIPRNTKAHIFNYLKFLLLKEGSSVVCPGGEYLQDLDGEEWSPENPGDDPDAGFRRAAVRHVKDQTGLDLSRVELWWRFLEIYYDHETYQEVTLFYVLSQWDLRPDYEQFLESWKERKHARLVKEREAQLRTRLAKHHAEKRKKAERKKNEEAAKKKAEEARARVKARQALKTTDDKKPKDGKTEDGKSKTPDPKTKEGQIEPEVTGDPMEVPPETDIKGGDSEVVKDEPKGGIDIDLIMEAKGDEVPHPDTIDPLPAATTATTASAATTTAAAATTAAATDDDDVDDESLLVKWDAALPPIDMDKEKLPVEASLYVNASIKHDPSVPPPPPFTRDHPKALMLPLGALLEYDLANVTQGSFEVSLFAENFHERLQLDFGTKIYASVQKYTIKKEIEAEKKKQQEQQQQQQQQQEEAEKQTTTTTTKEVTEEEAARKAATTMGIEEDDDVIDVGTEEKEIEKQKKNIEAGGTPGEDSKKRKREEEVLEDTKKKLKPTGALEDVEDSKDNEETKTQPESTTPSDTTTTQVPKSTPPEILPLPPPHPVDPSLQQAFWYFDVNHVGFFRSVDMSRLFHCLGLMLTRHSVENLIRRGWGGNTQRLYYLPVMVLQEEVEGEGQGEDVMTVEVERVEKVADE